MSYINSLNLLGTEPSTDISEETLTEELSLWANAQFTFDTTPGSALLDDFTKDVNKNEADLFATLTELGQQQQQQQQQQQTTTSNAYLAPASYLVPMQQQQQQSSSQQQQQHHGLARIAPAPTPIDLTSSSWANVLAPNKSTTPLTNRKRKQAPSETSSPTTPSTTTSDTLDAKEKVLAEEDKRRRNTAASARFRMKKKMREQALEQTAKEMTTKAEALEKRVKELEMEAKWLRALVVEKDPKLLERNMAATTTTPSTSS